MMLRIKCVLGGGVKLRRGFTLVELLIVIVVIGILAAMMLFSSTEAVISAKVNNIITTLRDLRTAALAWRSDHIDRDFPHARSNGGDKEKKDWQEIVSYLNSNSKPEAGELKNYYFQPYGFNSDVEFWYVQYKIQGAHSEEIKKRLAGRAKLEHLLKYAYGGEVAQFSTGNITSQDVFWDKNREEFFDGVEGNTDIVLYRIY